MGKRNKKSGKTKLEKFNLAASVFNFLAAIILLLKAIID